MSGRFCPVTIWVIASNILILDQIIYGVPQSSFCLSKLDGISIVDTHSYENCLQIAIQKDLHFL